MIEFDEYKGRLNAAKPGLDGLGRALKLDDVRAEISSLEAESAKDGFWNDVNNSQKVQKRLKQLQNKLGGYEKLCSQWDDLMTICEMAIEENDESMLDELKSGFAQFESTLESMRLSTLRSGEYDANNAILTIHPGAGGTEAQDWAQMLYRMYTRWAERHGYTYTLLDWQGRTARRRASSPPASRLRARTPTAISRASTAYTAWCASLPSTPPAGGRPASPPLRSCPR